MWLTPPSPWSTPFLNVHWPSRSESPAMTRFMVVVSSTLDFAFSGATFQSLKDFASRMVTQPVWSFDAFLDWFFDLPIAGDAAAPRRHAASIHTCCVRIAIPLSGCPGKYRGRRAEGETRTRERSCERSCDASALRREARREAVGLTCTSSRPQQRGERGARLEHFAVRRAEGAHPDVERAAVGRFGVVRLALVAQQTGEAVQRDGQLGIAGAQPRLLDRQGTTEEGLRLIESPELPVGLGEVVVHRRDVGM